MTTPIPHLTGITRRVETPRTQRCHLVQYYSNFLTAFRLKGKLYRVRRGKGRTNWGER